MHKVNITSVDYLLNLTDEKAMYTRKKEKKKRRSKEVNAGSVKGPRICLASVKFY